MLDVIRRCPNLDFLLLTKRPEKWGPRLDAVADYLWADTSRDHQREYEFVVGWMTQGGHTVHHDYPGNLAGTPQNIWIGVTVENQEMADKRIPELLKIPAKVRFLSVEPLLEPVHNMRLCALDGPLIDWVIVGGESGPKARECDVSWIDLIFRQCQSAGVPVFLKQLGTLCTTANANMFDWPAPTRFLEYGTGYAAARVMLHDPKGGNPAEWPADLRVQQFPKVDR
jgi:hypothetical protein